MQTRPNQTLGYLHIPEPEPTSASEAPTSLPMAPVGSDVGRFKVLERSGRACQLDTPFPEDDIALACSLVLV